MSYTKLNNLTGWAVFAIAFITYFLTAAPTASFWDCGEFIACAHELEVTHPPGAPLFLLIGRIFSMFAIDKQHIAFMVNMISVLSSAFTSLFTCWVTTYFASKALKNLDWEEDVKLYGTMFAGAVAGLACTFADSIWFNAVEAEVYAMSGFFTAIVVWLMTKWEVRADEPDHYKWIILIAYVMGLSIGVHLLNLLTIPALALMFYFRKYDANWKGILATFGISVLILAFVQYGIIQYTFSIAQEFELFFTGSITRAGQDRGGMGMPMGTGSAIFALLIVATVVGLLWYSIKKKNVILNVAVLSYIVIMMGFSSYTVIFVRSGANPPIDMNNPENILTFLSYMRREQYGERPLFRGAMYNAIPKNDGRRYLFEDKYLRYTLFEGKDKYVEDEMKQDYMYEDSDIKLFPRMYSESHYMSRPFGYNEFVKNKGENPQDPTDDVPTAGEDIAFAFRYQLVHMYLRYFMWNFVGRESDIQDDNWEDGIFMSNPEMKDNKGQNHYFFLPLLLGMMGLIWQFSHKNKDASIVGLLFFFTGLAIIIYLNQTPAQPRERDYAYASSFQTFCIWIGMGVLFLIETFRKTFKKNTPFIVGGVSLLVPALMCGQNWDDHTRKNRWIDVEFAYNLLNSCAKNAILFTAGDNDTFPLWYAQEVENVRPDVRVVNLELLISDWYIRQMQMQKNESAPLPIAMKYNDYAGEKFNYYIGSKPKPFRILTNKDAMVKAGAISETEKIAIADTFVWDFPSKGAILRKDSAMINIIRNIASSNWDRPIYFANTIPPENYHGLTYQLQMEGMAHRLLPIKLNPEMPRDIMTEGIVNQAKMYENVLKNFKYTGLNEAKLNTDEHIRMVIVSNYRNTMHRLMASYGQQIENWEAQMEIVKTPNPEKDSLAKIGLDVANIPTANPAKIAAAKIKLKEVYDFSQKTIPYNVIEPPVTYLTWSAEMLYRAGMDKEAESEFSMLKTLSMNTLRDYHKKQIQVDKRHPAVTGAVMTAQYLAQSGREKEAMALAEELYVLTGHDLRGVLQGR